jgi:hypothetical protein
MLITPPRSENIPPSDARVSGVAYLTIDASKDKFDDGLEHATWFLVSGFWFWFMVSGLKSGI